MLVLTNIDELKHVLSTKLKRERINSSIQQKYKKYLKPIKNISYINHYSPTNCKKNNNSIEENKNKNNNNNSSSIFNLEKEKKILNKNLKNQIKIINYSTEKLKKEREIFPNIIEFNSKSKNKKSFLKIRANYSSLTNIFFNRPIDIDKFIKEINSFLLPNDKTFEHLQNLMNYKIILNNDYSKINAYIQSFKIKEVPIYTFNYGLIFKYLIKNTFKEALKKAFSNQTLITKNEIREEYQRQINNIKQYLNKYNQEKLYLKNNQDFQSLIINNNSSSSISNINNKRLINLERNKRNRKIFQSNSSDNIFSHLDNYNKELFSTKFQNFDLKIKKLNKKIILKSSPENNTSHKENIKNPFENVIFKAKINFLREQKRFKDIIKKQKSIINHFIKLEKQINNKNGNKSEDITNSINNSQKSIIFENLFIKEKINKFLFQENKLKENEYNINSLKGFEDKRLNINNSNIDIDNELKDKHLNSKNNISLLKNSSLKRSPFDEIIIKGKKLYNNIGQDNNQNYKKIIIENYSQLNNNDIKPIKKDKGEIKKDNNNMKKSFFLKRKKALNIERFKDFLDEDDYESFGKDLKTERLKKMNNEIEDKF